MSLTEESMRSTRPTPRHAGSTNHCLEIQRLFVFAEGPLDHAEAHARRHIETCPICAQQFSVLRAARLLADCPARWTVHLGAAVRACEPISRDNTFQLLGRIEIETRSFEACHEEDWVSSTTAMRVNLVASPSIEYWSLTIVDVPLGVESIGVMTAKGLQRLSQSEDGTEFELVLTGDDPLSDVVSATYGDLWDMLAACKLQLVIDMADEAGNALVHCEANDIIELLEHHQAIERSADYVLPSGRHCDTFINVANVCSREESMHFLASKIDFLFWNCHFDTVLANGWAMSLIGRRLADARESQGSCRDCIRQVLSEGYSDPMLLDDIAPGSRVLILMDVVVTGKLAEQLQRLVRGSGGEVVGVAALVQPHGTSIVGPMNLRTLCEVEMNVVDTKKSACQRCGLVSTQYFNPIAGCMTTKASAPRSPSEFLDEDENARELWKVVEATGAYEHHRREGDTHYIGFVDTRKLLTSRAVGKALTDKLVNILSRTGNRPTVLLVPSRVRAELFARMLAGELRKVAEHRLRIVTAQRKWTTGKWELAPRDAVVLTNEDVLIVDTAAGHGRTVDQLASLADKLNAKRVGAAVLLSRLTPPCEDAFNLRLSGGFHRLFNLPIRPVAIRGDRIDLCPVCRRKNAIRQFADDSNIEPLEQWAESLFRVRRSPEKTSQPCRDRQLTLFEEEPFLSECGAAVASGVTLHALGASRVNGSAPLRLPELADDRIPWRARATMVENLPSGVLDWTGETLVQDLIKVLDAGEYPSIWKATANLLAREGSDLWLGYLDALLVRLTESSHRTSESFWNHMACNAFLLAANHAGAREEIRSRVEHLLQRDVDDTTLSGLQRMREVIDG